MPALRLTPVRCDWGGTGVSLPGHWAVIASFDVATDHEIESLRVQDLTIFDGTSSAITRAVAPIELRERLPGLDEQHNPRTRPFEGSIGTGVTLRLEAIAHLAPMSGGIPERSRYLMTLTTAPAGERVELSGPVGSAWPTAGPARAP